MSIRGLRAGEVVPTSAPKRYRSSHGYWRLRWLVGNRQYVEVYEHRVKDGVVTESDHVHHINGDKADNRPENLAPISAAAHASEHHRRLDYDEVVRLYESGMTTVEVAGVLGCYPSAVSGALKKMGVATRPANFNRMVALDEDEVVRLFRSGVRPPAIAKAMGCSRTPVDRVLRERGISSHPPGRPNA
jgi:hypothetical protein